MGGGQVGTEGGGAVYDTRHGATRESEAGDPRMVHGENTGAARQGGRQTDNLHRHAAITVDAKHILTFSSDGEKSRVI